MPDVKPMKVEWAVWEIVNSYQMFTKDMPAHFVARVHFDALAQQLAQAKERLDKFETYYVHQDVLLEEQDKLAQVRQERVKDVSECVSLTQRLSKAETDRDALQQCIFTCPQMHTIYVEGGRKSDDDIPCPHCEKDALQRRVHDYEQQLAGTPTRRFYVIMDELQRRFPHPNPYDSTKAPEQYALEAIDALQTRLEEALHAKAALFHASKDAWDAVTSLLHLAPTTDSSGVRAAIQALQTRLTTAEAALEVVDKHLDVMMGDGSGMPFQTFVTQTALVRNVVKEAIRTR